MTTLSGIPENFLIEFKNLQDRVAVLEDQLRRTGSGDLADECITETVIAPDSISTPKLQANAVITSKLAANAVTANEIAANAVISDKIAADNVLADHISVTDLSAINADMGSITAGTITGAVHRTSASNPKVQMDSTGVFATDSSGTEIIHINSDGTIDTGASIFKASETSTSSVTYVAVGSTDLTFRIKQGTWYSLWLEADLKSSDIGSEAQVSLIETSGKDGLAGVGGDPPVLLATTGTSYAHIKTTNSIGGSAGAYFGSFMPIKATSATGNRTWRVVLRSQSAFETAYVENISLYVKTT